MKKIALIGLRYDFNTGDPLLFYCTEWMLKKLCDNELEIVHLDFFARSGYPAVPEKHPDILKSVAKAVLKIIPTKLWLGKYQKVKEQQTTDELAGIRNYYEQNLKDVDLIIIIGAGSLQYNLRLDFSLYYEAIVKVAKKNNIPCVISCIGVESKYDAEDERCIRFSNTLSDDIVKIITTRDDIDELRNYVKNPNTDIAKTADIAVWAAETFDIQKDEKSDLIGIGVIIHSRFAEYQTGISREEYEQALKDVIERLEQNNEKWVMFNNGHFEDAEYAEYLCKMLGKDPKKYLLKAPKSPEELVKTISGFKGIITSRLHSCISAYSLNIPFVAISWNNKLEFFANSIGCADRIIKKDRLSGDVIVDAFYDAMKDGYNQSDRGEYRNTVVEYFKKYLEVTDN